MWMRRGTQGHVALPRDARDGLRGARMTRVHVLLLYSIFYNGYSTYKHSIEEFKLNV